MNHPPEKIQCSIGTKLAIFPRRNKEPAQNYVELQNTVLAAKHDDKIVQLQNNWLVTASTALQYGMMQSMFRTSWLTAHFCFLAALQRGNI